MTVKTNNPVPQVQTSIGGVAVVRNVRNGPKVFLPNITPNSLLDQRQTHRHLTEMAKAIDQAHTMASSNPLAGSVQIRNQVFTAGQARIIVHNLGTPYVRWSCIRAQLNGWNGIELALPSGQNASQAIYLQSFNTGTYDFEIA